MLSKHCKLELESVLVVLGGFINTAVVSTLASTFSLLYASLLNDTSSATKSWIFNLNQFVWNFSSILVGPLISIFSFRSVTLLGSCMIVISTMINAFVNDHRVLFLTYSFITGLGQACITVPSMVIVPLFFKKRRGLATGITVSGYCAGNAIGPLLVEKLLTEYGYKWTNLILGAVFLHSAVAALIFKIASHEESSQKHTYKKIELQVNAGTEKQNTLTDDGYVETKKNLKKEELPVDTIYQSFDTSEKSCTSYTNSNLLRIQSQKQISVIKLLTEHVNQLRRHTVKVIAFSFALVLATYFNFIMIVPFAMNEHDYSMKDTAWAISISGICNFIIRLFVTFSTDVFKLSTKFYIITGAFLMSVSMLVFSFAGTNYTVVLITLSTFGLGAGACVCVLPLAIIEFAGINYLSHCIGLIGLITSAVFVIIAPVTGSLTDHLLLRNQNLKWYAASSIENTSIFSTSIQVLAAAPVLAIFLWILMPFAATVDAKKEYRNREKLATIEYSTVRS